MESIQNTLQSYISKIIKEHWDISIKIQQVLISETPSPAIGHKATSVAFILAKELKKSPVAIADELAPLLQNHPHFDKIESLKGYINIFFKPQYLLDIVIKNNNNTQAYNFTPKEEKIHLEFISANPTGPLHIGHGRWAVLGDSLARILKKVGYEVFTEFYVNDAGSQIQKLKDSVTAIKNNQPIPENGYHGEYLKEVALTDEEPVDFFKNQHNNLIKSIGVTMDNYYSEKSLLENQLINKAIQNLKDLGLIYESEGAVFFKTTSYGDDKDRALIKSDGNYTYFAPDIAYHYTKIQSGAHWIIDILGADHHGYIKRMSAAVDALSHGKTKFSVLLGQLVNLMKNGEPVKMSKRAGNIVSLEEVIEEIGVDALRIVLLSKKFHHSIDFDLGLLTQKNKENPLFYIQYAYARIHSIIITLSVEDLVTTLPEADLTLGNDEILLLLHMFNYKSTVLLASKEMDPYYLYAYIYELASLFHKFYEKSRIKEQDIVISHRVAIIQGVANILNDGASLLGISMPQKI